MFGKIIFKKIVGNEIFGFLPDFGEKSIFQQFGHPKMTLQRDILQF